MKKETIDERIEFKDDIKKILYGKTNNNCAACGVKLTKNNRSLDHAIPLAYGGTNDLRNIIGLCKECNIRKDSFIYWPSAFYIYLFKVGSTNVLRDLNAYIMEWVDRWCEKDDIIENPLIADKVSIFLIPMDMTKLLSIDKSRVIQKQFIWDLTELSGYDDSETVSTKIGLQYSDIEKTVPNPNNMYSVYALKKRTNDSWGFLCSIQIIDNNVFISEIWSMLGYGMVSSVLNFIARTFYKIWAGEKTSCTRVFITTKTKTTMMSLFEQLLMFKWDVNGSVLFGEDYKRATKDEIYYYWETIKERTLILLFESKAEKVRELACEEMRSKMSERG